MKKILLILPLIALSVCADYLKFSVSTTQSEASLTAHSILKKIKEDNPKANVGLFKNPTLFTQNSTLVALKMGWIDLALFEEKGLERIIGAKKGLAQALDSLGFKGCGPYKDGTYLIISKKKWNTFALTTQNALQSFTPPTAELETKSITPASVSVPLKNDLLPPPTPAVTPVESQEKKPYNPRLLQES